MKPLTTIHVTHEAAEKIGGIGAVLEGLSASPVYQSAVGRSILVGPLFNHFERVPEQRLGADAEVLYSSLDGIDRANLGMRFHPIEWAFNVAIVYGRRRFKAPGDGRQGEAEILLVDVAQAARARVDRFKHRLWEHFGLDCARHEGDWGFEEYVRLAEPGVHAALALIRPEELPAALLAHEYMGLPAAFKAILDTQHQVRTVFHAHECSTARRVVEGHPGHDLRFYNAMWAARPRGLRLEQVFGPQSDSARHELVRRSHCCDAILAVGEFVAQEIDFLDERFDHHAIDLVHNGIPWWEVRPREKLAARSALRAWSKARVGLEPDLLMTHVTRPVVSKGIWRDFRVCHRLDARLAAEGRTGLLLVLTSAGGVRRPQDVASMADEYGWPARHRAEYPDLVGPEVELAALCEAFNDSHRAIRAVLVNQFGWSGALVGTPEIEMDMDTLRAGADIEFGMATYEPFGISPLEPLAAGAVCVISHVCGCRRFVEEACGGSLPPQVVSGDFTSLPRGDRPLESLLAIGHVERDEVEERVADEVAEKVWAVAPRTDEDRLRLLAQGQALAARLGWDAVLEHHLLPTLRRVVAEARPAADAVRAPLSAT